MHEIATRGAIVTEARKHCSTDGQTTDVWSSEHWVHAVCELWYTRGSLHFPTNVTAKKVGLALCIQNPSAVI